MASLARLGQRRLVSSFVPVYTCGAPLLPHAGPSRSRLLHTLPTRPSLLAASPTSRLLVPRRSFSRTRPALSPKRSAAARMQKRGRPIRKKIKTRTAAKSRFRWRPRGIVHGTSGKRHGNAGNRHAKSVRLRRTKLVSAAFKRTLTKMLGGKKIRRR